jgi:AcrR family transcriptional regulator
MAGKRLSAGERRTQLIEVGRAVFAEKGFDATTVEEIAERAGISKPIVYEHFGGKEGLYAVIVDREMEHVIGEISAAIAEGSPKVRVEGAALAFLTYVKERPDGFAVLSRDAPANVGMASLLAEVGERVGKVFTAEFRKAGYDTRFAPIYSQALIGMVTFVGQWWMEDRKVPVEDVAAHLAALAWTGLGRLPKRPPKVSSPRRA